MTAHPLKDRRYTIYAIENLDLRQRRFYVTSGRIRDALAAFKESPPRAYAKWNWDRHNVGCVPLYRNVWGIAVPLHIVGLKLGILPLRNRRWL